MITFRNKGLPYSTNIQWWLLNAWCRICVDIDWQNDCETKPKSNAYFNSKGHHNPVIHSYQITLPCTGCWLQRHLDLCSIKVHIIKNYEDVSTTERCISNLNLMYTYWRIHEMWRIQKEARIQEEGGIWCNLLIVYLSLVLYRRTPPHCEQCDICPRVYRLQVGVQYYSGAPILIA
jgi:hypothetical protein